MFHGNDERVDQESLALSTQLWEAVARDLIGWAHADGDRGNSVVAVLLAEELLDLVGELVGGRERRCRRRGALRA